MPLLDHFHPPLSRRRHWDSFHGAWAEALARQLNESLLPENLFAEARVNVGGRVEMDVSTFEEGPSSETDQNGGVAVWAPPRPVATAPLDFSNLDTFEVQVINDEEGPKVVAAIELVSPANKDRASHRRMFAVKCASYLQEDIGLMVIDVVTERHGNLHASLLELLQIAAPTPAQGPKDLYVAAYRTVGAKERSLEIWTQPLTIGSPLPTMPLWLGREQSIPLDLESTYLAACASRRI
ncbi:MAG: DUF4058 family protein [Planctomycetes bacterium]|nr:DUF4058 family protein [Planctomycetota bacterium]